jgi:general secretion pathway protein M
MMGTWWNALQPRERNMLAIGGVVCAILLTWAFVWHPLALARVGAHVRVERARDDVTWMRSMIGQANELHSQGSRGHVERQGKSLLALADASARSAGLSGALKRVEPTGGNSVRVSFEVANFDVLIEWLSQLARDYGVRVSDFSADKVEGIGLVNARVTLEEGQR